MEAGAVPKITSQVRKLSLTKSDAHSNLSSRNRPSARLAALTRKLNEIKGRMQEFTLTNAIYISEHLDILDERAQNWRIAHSQYVSEVTEEGEKEKMNQQFEDTNQDIEGLIFKAQEYLQAMELLQGKSILTLIAEQENEPLMSDLDQGLEPEDSASNVTVGRQSMSEIRLRLAEDTAKTKAEFETEEELARRKIKYQQDVETLGSNLAAGLVLEKEQNRLRDEYENDCRQIHIKRKLLKNQFWKQELDDLDKNERKSKPQNDLGRNEPRVESTRMATTMERPPMPSFQPTVFDGEDITKYENFRRVFELTIGERPISAAGKYQFLLNYTRGQAHALVDSCQSRDYDRAYSQAWRVLEKTYGDTIYVTQLLLKKLGEWPALKNGEHKRLGEFSIFLQKCRQMQENNSELSSLDQHFEIKKLIEKLPPWVYSEFRKYAQELKERGTLLKFAHLVDFVLKKADEVSNPLFSEPFTKSREFLGNRKERFTSVALSTGRFDKLPKAEACVFCKKSNHAPDRCLFFKKYSEDDKKKAIIEKGLCYGCLRPGHRTKECRNRSKCEICKKFHPTALHKEGSVSEGDTGREPKNDPVDPETKPQNESQDTAKAQDDYLTHLAMTTSNRYAEGVLVPAVPVRIRFKDVGRTVQTYALLDTGSDSCFISAELLGELGETKGIRQIWHSLRTLGSDRSCVRAGLARGLEVLSWDGSYAVELDEVVCRRDWPLTENHPVYSEEVENLNIFNEVPLVYLNKPIQLIIGSDQVKLVQNLETISNVEETIYAVKYKLGWAITGKMPAATPGSLRSISLCSQVKRQREEASSRCETEQRIRRQAKDRNKAPAQELREVGTVNSIYQKRVLSQEIETLKKKLSEADCEADRRTKEISELNTQITNQKAKILKFEAILEGKEPPSEGFFTPKSVPSIEEEKENLAMPAQKLENDANVPKAKSKVGNNRTKPQKGLSESARKERSPGPSKMDSKGKEAHRKVRQLGKKSITRQLRKGSNRQSRDRCKKKEVETEPVPRDQGNTGVINKVFPSSDGHIRAVKVSTRLKRAKASTHEASKGRRIDGSPQIYHVEVT